MGITILAVLAAIGGVFGLIGALALVGTGVGLILGLLLLALSVLYIGFAYGAWTLKPWAWTLGIVAAVGRIVLVALSVVTGGSIAGEIVGLLISVGILYYLMTPEIKKAFGRA
jgi:hypothetical protein